MTVRFQKLVIILLSLIFLASAIILILINSKNNLVFFFTPSELINSTIKVNQKVRIGGFNKSSSLTLDSQTNIYKFLITDNKNDIEVIFEGILPDLFREELGAVVEGTLINDKTLVASKVFAKHDENYMPSSIKKQLKKSDYWNKKY